MLNESRKLDEYIEIFRNFLKSEQANIKSVVYIWRTSKTFNRVIGESNIIYIGQTKNTFRNRYENLRSLAIEKVYFNRYYRFLIEKYGAISIEIIQTDEPKFEEYNKLMEYNDKHKEYPPLNRAIPSKPEKIIQSEIEDLEK